MSVLSYNELVKLVDAGVVTNIRSNEQIKGASIDVHLGFSLLVEAHPCPNVRRHKPISFSDREPLPMVEIGIENGYVIQPGEFILAHTVEVFKTPLNLAARFSMKSSAARVGLENLNAGWCDPGWTGSALTLELINCSRYTPIILRAGDCVGQMIFYELTSEVPAERSYLVRGRYNNDRKVNGIKL